MFDYIELLKLFDFSSTFYLLYLVTV